MQEFQTNKSELTKSRIVDSKTGDLGDKQIKVKIDRFAFTANNITYAVMGEQLRYWEFFNPQGENSEQWGIIPVWGFADVTQSNCADVPVGDRLFGYFPPAHEQIMTPSRISPGMFIEASAHRTSLPAGYNMYRRVKAEPGYNPELDNERMLLFVLHLTSFCLHQMLISNDWFGAEQVVIISASSKTSTGLAYGLANDENAPKVVGLTSARNLDLVNQIDAYDSALSYDHTKEIDASKPTVIIDMSANTSVLSQLHIHLGNNMRFTSNVGLTHWEEPQQVVGIIQERSKMFFAPDEIQRMIKEWGQTEFDRKSMTYVAHSVAQSRAWMKIRELNGLHELADAYASVCDGSISPDEGLVVVM